LVFNDYPGRTAQSDAVTGANTYAFDLGLGGTWDAASGGTGPLYSLSKGIFLSPYGLTGYNDLGLSGASAAYQILGTADAADWNNQGSYWVIYPHPNSREISDIAAGISFSSVKMLPFFYIDIGGNTAGVITEFTTRPSA